VYSYDASAPVDDQLPAAVVLPGSREEVVKLVQFANRERIPIVPRGSGTGLAGGAVPLPGSMVVLMHRMNHILEIDTANLTARVEPGVITAELASQVEKVGLFYPPDPGSMAISTIGGNLALNSGGLRGLKYGVTRDYVMGLEVVLPTGEVLQTGGKCKKDAAGYHLSSLFVGSEGTLGIITQALLHLLPLPEAQRTALAFFNSIDQAAQVVAAIIAARIIPVTLELLDDISIRCVENYAHLGLPKDASALLLVEVDGFNAQVEIEIERIAAICRANGARGLEVAHEKSQADQLKAARRATLAALARARPTTILEDVTVPRSQIPNMVRRIREIAAKHRVEIAIFGHAGDGNLHPTGMTDSRNADELARVEAAFEEIFDAALELGGTITGEHGVGLKKRHVLPKRLGPVGIATMKAIKNGLDPNHILNPGKVIEI
jgi:glycolate oxidase